MPHKRRKFSDRQAVRDFRGTDFAPGGGGGSDLSKEALPKGKMNILRGAEIRKAFHERRKLDKGKGKAKATAEDEEEPTNMRIRVGERMRDFHARVEQAFAPDISAAGRSASKRAKKRKQADVAEDTDDLEARRAGAAKARERDAQDKAALKAQRQALTEPRDFASAAGGVRKSVRDVVDRPPDLLIGARMGRLAAKQAGSDARRRELEQERERVVQLYRRKRDAELAQKQQSRG